MLTVKPLGWGTTLSKTHDMPKKARPACEQPSPGPTPSVNAPVGGGMAWAAQLHAVMQHHVWAAAVQTPGGSAGQFAAHQALLVALRAQQAGAAGGGAAVASAPAAGSSAKEASSFGPTSRPYITYMTARSTPMYPPSSTTSLTFLLAISSVHA